jgi:hypothetical protein
MLGADDLVDLKGALDRGDPTFIFLGKGEAAPQEQVEVIGSVVLQLLFQAAYAAGRGRRPYQLFCDEFFHLLDAPGLGRSFETALTTLRSFGVTLALVMHQFSQVGGNLRETILGNCDVVASFRTSSRNAQFFGEFLPETDPELVDQALRKTGRPPSRMEIKAQLVERLQRLPNRTLYWYDRRRPYRAVRVRVPDLPEPHEAAGISADALERFIEAEGITRGSAALPKETLRQQIDARARRLKDLVRPPVEVQASQNGHGELQTTHATRSRRPHIG